MAREACCGLNGDAVLCESSMRFSLTDLYLWGVCAKCPQVCKQLCLLGFEIGFLATGECKPGSAEWLCMLVGYCYLTMQNCGFPPLQTELSEHTLGGSHEVMRLMALSSFLPLFLHNSCCQRFNICGCRGQNILVRSCD